jgi:UDP-glucose 4-epimerase
MVLPRFVQSALANQPITIYGDGSQSRVFCHVQDAIKAILTLAATDSTIGDVFNVGGVGETTVKELAEQIIKQTNSTSTITYTPYTDAYPAGFEDMQRRVPDITKIKKTISWQPEHTLASIIDDVAQSMRGS